MKRLDRFFGEGLYVCRCGWCNDMNHTIYIIVTQDVYTNLMSHMHPTWEAWVMSVALVFNSMIQPPGVDSALCGYDIRYHTWTRQQSLEKLA